MTAIERHEMTVNRVRNERLFNVVLSPAVHERVTMTQVDADESNDSHQGRKCEEYNAVKRGTPQCENLKWSVA